MKYYNLTGFVWYCSDSLTEQIINQRECFSVFYKVPKYTDVEITSRIPVNKLFIFEILVDDNVVQRIMGGRDSIGLLCASYSSPVFEDVITELRWSYNSPNIPFFEGIVVNVKKSFEKRTDIHKSISLSDESTYKSYRLVTHEIDNKTYKLNLENAGDYFQLYIKDGSDPEYGGGSFCPGWMLKEYNAIVKGRLIEIKGMYGKSLKIPVRLGLSGIKK